MKTFLSRAAVTGSLVFAGVVGHAQTYSYQKFSVSSNVFTHALDISDAGRVVGWDTDYVHVYGFIEQGGVAMNVPVAGASSVQLTATQGSTLYGIENGLGFSMDAKGTVSLLKIALNITALPNAANSNAVVVGTYQSQMVHQGSFILQNGVYKTYSVPGSYDTSFNAINNGGVIVGTWNARGAALQSFKLANGQLSPILFPGSYSTIATGINDAGEIVGWYYKTANGPLGLFRYDGKSYTDITTPANSYACVARHINNVGEFVGECTDKTTYQTYSFVATPQQSSGIVLPPQ